MTEIEIKVAEPGSERLEEIDEFFQNVQIEQSLYWFVRRENVDRCARRKDRRLLYFLRGDRVSGACMVWAESDILAPEEACLRNIAVSANERHNGYGTELLEEAVEYAEERGKEVMVADVLSTADLEEFWLDNDFGAVDYYYTDRGNRMVVYERELEPQFQVEDPLDF
ncbi:acetyltransferase [Haloarcula virus HCTV-16]|nr:acetyltransferase [Haloarcula virus HCTV-16]